jgi:hypothetical protein
MEQHIFKPGAEVGMTSGPWSGSGGSPESGNHSPPKRFFPHAGDGSWPSRCRAFAIFLNSFAKNKRRSSLLMVEVPNLELKLEAVYHNLTITTTGHVV